MTKLSENTGTVLVSLGADATGWEAVWHDGQIETLLCWCLVRDTFEDGYTQRRVSAVAMTEDMGPVLIDDIHSGAVNFRRIGLGPDAATPPGP